MKKLFFTVIATSLLLSCSQNEEIEVGNPNQERELATSRLAFGENVKLIKAKDSRSLSCSRAGCESIQLREYLVEVTNLAYSKTVAVHQQLNDGQWEDVYLAYSFTTSTGTEIWKGTSRKSVRTFISPSPNAYGEKLAAKYVVNGQTYWDSNSNSNYTIVNSNRQDYSSFLYLNQDFNIFQSEATLYTYNDLSYLTVAADIRNIAFAKEVKVIYTTNNWATTNTRLLVFSTNDNNNATTAFERWTTSFSIPKTNKVVYALSYKVNGQTYWDNNFGANYTLLSN